MNRIIRTRGLQLCEDGGSMVLRNLRGCIQTFPDWPPGARTANDAALCH